MNSTIPNARSYAHAVKRLLKAHGATHMQSHDLAARTLGARDWRDLVTRKAGGAERDHVEARLRGELAAYPDVDAAAAVAILLPPSGQEQAPAAPARFTELVAARLLALGTPIGDAVRRIVTVGKPSEFDEDELRPTTWVDNDGFGPRDLFGRTPMPMTAEEASKPVAWSGYEDMLGENSTHWSSRKTAARFGHVTKGSRMTARALASTSDDATRVAVMVAAFSLSGRIGIGDDYRRDMMERLETAGIDMTKVPRGKKLTPGYSDGIIARHDDPEFVDKVAKAISEVLGAHTVAVFVPHERTPAGLVEITADRVRAGDAPPVPVSQVERERTGHVRYEGRTIETLDDLERGFRYSPATFDDATRDAVVIRLGGVDKRGTSAQGAPWRAWEWRSSRIDPPAGLSGQAVGWWTANVGRMTEGYDHNGHLASVSDVMAAIIAAHPAPAEIAPSDLGRIRDAIKTHQGWHAKRRIDVALAALSLGPTMYEIEIDGHHIQSSRTTEGAFVDALPPCPQVVDAMEKALGRTAAGRAILKEAEWIGGQFMWTGLRISGLEGTIVIHEGHRGVASKVLAKAARRWADVVLRLSMGMRPENGPTAA